MAEAKQPAKPKKAAATKKIIGKSASPEKAKLEKIIESTKEATAAEAVEIIEEAEVESSEVEVTPLAKAGKRSPKAVAEAEQKLVKEERKKSAEAEPADQPKPVQKPSRPKSERAGKKYREVIKLIDKTKTYSLPEALELATKTSTTKFDATVELHVNLGVDPKQADQNVRDTLALPSGTGKTIRLAVLAEADDAAAAKAAGADIAGSDSLFESLDKDQIDFDVLVATPNMMPRLGKYARLLGPRGLMPNPKSGTVTTDVAKAVAEAKGGKVEYRVDQAGIVHLGIGKVSFGPAKLQANADAVMASIRAAKPASLKGNYITSIHVTTSMGPSISVTL